MKKTILIFIPFIFLSCSSTKEITGIYRGSNYFGISELNLKKDKTFTYKIDRAMMSDSVSGYYINENRIVKLIATTKDLEITKIQKEKPALNNKINITFIDPHRLSYGSFDGDTLKINNKEVILDQFYNYKMTVNCNDKIYYQSDQARLKIDSLKCGTDYFLKIYKRTIHKMISDTIDIDFSKSHKIELDNFILKK